MNLLAAEAIKLTSTRSAWWAATFATVLTLGLAMLSATSATEPVLAVVDTQLGAGPGIVVIMVMTVVSVTGEYHHGTIALTFQAVPNRTAAVLGKAGLLAAVGAALGVLHGFAGYGLALLASTVPVGSLDSADRWREVAGVSVYYALAAVIAVAVAFLVRSATAAVTGLLGWMFVVESVVAFAGPVGGRVQPWLPFTALAHSIGQAGGELPYGHWTAFGYSAVLAAGFLALAVVVVERRDA